jgi:translation initiation factor 2 subunit 1
LILATNTTRKRVRNVKKLLRVGTQDIMQVIHVDKEGGFIDLSKRTIQMADIEEKKKEFEKSKIVHLIMKLTARTLNVKVLDAYESFGFDLYDHFDHAFDSFKLALTEPDMVFSKLKCNEKEKLALI